MNDDTKKLLEYEIELEDNEEFKYIPKSKEVYVSNCGRFFKLECTDHLGRNWPSRWIYPRFNPAKNILNVTIPLLDGQSRVYNAATLVAEAFLDNPEHFKFVAFKNGDSTDIYIDNLTWASKKRKDVKKSKEKKIDRRTKEYRKKRVPYYDQEVWFADLSPNCWRYGTLEFASQFYHTTINEILNVCNNENKMGYIDNISQFSNYKGNGKYYPVYFSLRDPYKKELKYELHGQ